MGRQTDIKLIGTVDSLIFYEWRGVPSIRTKPEKVRQTKATKKQAGLFGIASHTGAKLRSLLKPALPYPKDRNMMRRFETAIAAWLRTGGAKSSSIQNGLPCITGFEFNESSELRQRLNINIAVSTNAANELVVDIPEMIAARDINAPAHTTNVVLKIQAAVCSLQTDDDSSSAGTTLNFPFDNSLIPPQQIVFPLKADAGNIAVVMISLEYILPRNGRSVLLKDIRWQPAGIVGALWGGV